MPEGRNRNPARRRQARKQVSPVPWPVIITLLIVAGILAVLLAR
jgi:hypothetical protein